MHMVGHDHRFLHNDVVSAALFYGECRQCRHAGRRIEQPTAVVDRAKHLGTPRDGKGNENSRPARVVIALEAAIMTGPGTVRYCL